MGTAAEVDGYVKANITDVNAISQDAVTQAKEFLDDLAQATPDAPPYIEIENMDVERGYVSINVDAPERPNIENLVDDETIPDLGDIYIPDAPSVSNPTAPILQDIVIPDGPSIDIVPFELEFPEETITDATVGDFEYTEAEYTSLLKDAVEAKLRDNIENGGTGLLPDVETAIFERGLEREKIVMEEAAAALTSEWAKTGWPLPNGVLAANLNDLYEKDELSKLDRSRDIEIKQAELEQKNTHFAITASVNFEGILIAHADNVANRALEAAKATVSLGIALFNVQVDRFKTRLEAYRTGAQAWEALIRGELAKVDIYKAEMQGASLQASVQEQRVSTYRAQIEAVNSIYDQYKTRVEAASVTANIEAQRLNAYKTKVTAQLDKVRALVATYEADTNRYSATIREGEAWANTFVKQQELVARNADANLTRSLEVAKINLQAFMNIANMNIQQSEGGAQIYTNLAGAALNSLNSVISLGSTSAVTKAEEGTA